MVRTPRTRVNAGVSPWTGPPLCSAWRWWPLTHAFPSSTPEPGCHALRNGFHLDLVNFMYPPPLFTQMLRTHLSSAICS